MTTPGSDLPPEESTFMEEMYSDIIKKQERRRRRTFRAIITLCVTALVIGAIIGWRYNIVLH
jgi:predicted nucleic acid-binding Zn ribbon protein